MMPTANENLAASALLHATKKIAMATVSSARDALAIGGPSPRHFRSRPWPEATPSRSELDVKARAKDADVSMPRIVVER